MATFTHRVATTHAPATGTFGGNTTTTYTGEAVQVSGGSAEYERLAALNVQLEQAVVLLWTPDSYAERSLPPVGSTIVWAGVTLTLVAHLKVVAPDGVPILARLGCRR